MSALTCREVESIIDGFVDSELPPQQLLEVARHGAQCAACEAQMQTFTGIGHMLGETVRADAATLDLSGIWAGVERNLDAIDATRSREHRAARVGRLLRGPMIPAWGTALAVAASAVLYFQSAADIPPADSQAAVHRVSPSAIKPAGFKAASNQALIRRLSGKAVQVRQLPKDGTTVIWVNYAADGGR